MLIVVMCKTSFWNLKDNYQEYGTMKDIYKYFEKLHKHAICAHLKWVLPAIQVTSELGFICVQVI